MSRNQDWRSINKPHLQFSWMEQEEWLMQKSGPHLGLWRNVTCQSWIVVSDWILDNVGLRWVKGLSFVICATSSSVAPCTGSVPRPLPSHTIVHPEPQCWQQWFSSSDFSTFWWGDSTEIQACNQFVHGKGEGAPDFDKSKIENEAVQESVDSLWQGELGANPAGCGYVAVGCYRSDPE